MEPSKATSVNSRAEELFVQLFCEAFGPEKTENLQVQYPCVDIYGRHRYIDFALESPESKIAIEIDGETYHNPSKVSENKYADDLLKQNSLIYDNWKVYRWIYSQLEKQPEKVKDELITFLGSSPMFKAFEANLSVPRNAAMARICWSCSRMLPTKWISRLPWSVAFWCRFAVSGSRPTST